MEKRKTPYGHLDLNTKGYRIRAWPVDAEFSLQELIEIEHKLNRWEWDDRLGNKPKGWGSLPSYKKKPLIGKRKDKYSIIRPIQEEIEGWVPRYYRLRYHHMISFGATQEEFDTWWMRCGITR